MSHGSACRQGVIVVGSEQEVLSFAANAKSAAQKSENPASIDRVRIQSADSGRHLKVSENATTSVLCAELLVVVSIWQQGMYHTWRTSAVYNLLLFVALRPSASRCNPQDVENVSDGFCVACAAC